VFRWANHTSKDSHQIYKKNIQTIGKWTPWIGLAYNTFWVDKGSDVTRVALN